MKKVNLLLYMKSTIPILIICVILFSCKQSICQGSCNENPEYKDKLFVFIGEKINIEHLTADEGSMDAKFKATYKVIEPVCGNYDRDTIEFIVYDHYGIPAFSGYKNAMLFVTNYDDTFYHEKYQYFDVYKTKNGEWASPYQYDEYSRLDSNIKIKPERVNFFVSPAYNVKYRSKKVIQREYPNPYYKIVGDSAVAVWGNYPAELLELKKNGVLRARKIFGAPLSMLVQDVELADVLPAYQMSVTDSIEFINFFKKFISAINRNDSNSIKKMSLENVDCSICEGLPVYYYVNGKESISEFIRVLKSLNESTLWEKINNTRHYQIQADILDSLKLKNENGFLYSIYFDTKVNFPTYTTTQNHAFKFIKRNNDFKFYGIETH